MRRESNGNDPGQRTFFTFRRTQDGELAVRGSILGVVSGILFVVGVIGGSGVFRLGKWTYDDAMAQHRETMERINEVRKECAPRDRTKEKLTSQKQRILTLERQEERINDDIRNLFNLNAAVDRTHADITVVDQVNTTRFIVAEHEHRIKQLEKDQRMMMELINRKGFPKAN